MPACCSSTRRLSLAVVLLVGSVPVLAQPTDPNALYVRVVDVGAGLRCVVKMPGGHYMVYDAGNGVARPFKGVSDVIPDGEEIDLMILGHPRQVVADRYLALPGLDATKLFRTDRNDADEGLLEWSHASIDGADDDDVEIVIRADGTIEVEYR